MRNAPKRTAGGWRCPQIQQGKAKAAAFRVLGSTPCRVAQGRGLNSRLYQQLSNPQVTTERTRAGTQEPMHPQVFAWTWEASRHPWAGPASGQPGGPSLPTAKVRQAPVSEPHAGSRPGCGHFPTQSPPESSQGLCLGKPRSHSLLSPRGWGTGQGTRLLPPGSAHRLVQLQTGGIWEEGRAQSTHRA